METRESLTLQVIELMTSVPRIACVDRIRHVDHEEIKALPDTMIPLISVTGGDEETIHHNVSYGAHCDEMLTAFNIYVTCYVIDAAENIDSLLNFYFESVRSAFLKKTDWGEGVEKVEAAMVGTNFQEDTLGYFLAQLTIVYSHDPTNF